MQEGWSGYESVSVAASINDVGFTREVGSVWNRYYGSQKYSGGERLGMGVEVVGLFGTDLYIASWYCAVGGTPESAFKAAANGGAPIPSHHSPLFKIEPEGSVTLGVEASVSALLNVMAP